MIKRVIAVLAAVALLALGAACSPVGDTPGASSRIEDSPCRFNFEPEPFYEIRPVKMPAGLVPTHAVRAQAYACVDGLWSPIGGLASVYIDGISLDPRATGGVVKGPIAAPWPYSNASARLPFEFPIALPVGLQVVITAGFDTIALDVGELLSCWLVTPDGAMLPSSRFNTVSTGAIGRPTSVDCGATIGETA